MTAKATSKSRSGDQPMLPEAAALPPLYLPRDIAKALHCSEWWVKEQARRGRIPFTKLGGGYRFTAGHFTEITHIFESRPDESAGTVTAPAPAQHRPAGQVTAPVSPAQGPDPAPGAAQSVAVQRGVIPACRPVVVPGSARREESKLGYAENLGGYWRGRYKVSPGRYATVTGAGGETLRFGTKTAAKKAADAEEAKLRAGMKKAAAERITFGAYVSRWYAAQDLAASTMRNYRRHIEEHLLPAFEDQAVADIRSTGISAWEKRERAVPYAASGVRTWRATLHLILADAVDEGLRDANPAARRRGRGKRAGRSRNRGPEKVVTTALGILLLAERTAILSGRDDEFAAVVLNGCTGMRWAEIVGLETGFVRPKSVRVQWQLYEPGTGELRRCPPRDDSYRDMDTPGFLGALLAGHIARSRPRPCGCHGLTCVFRGHGAANGAASRPGAKLIDVARRAGVSAGTVSNVLNHLDAVAEPTRQKVLEAIREIGYARDAASGELAAHWRRSGFATWLFQPAATGWYPKRGRQDARPVPLAAEPWPGIPVRGRGASRRAEACWLPIAPGLTPHGLRHTHKTLMREAGTAPKLMDERMGHEDGSVQSRYDHITAGMRQALKAALTGMWEQSLTARLAMSPGSPVAVLDALLKARK